MDNVGEQSFTLLFDANYCSLKETAKKSASTFQLLPKTSLFVKYVENYCCQMTYDGKKDFNRQAYYNNNYHLCLLKRQQLSNDTLSNYQNIKSSLTKTKTNNREAEQNKIIKNVSDVIYSLAQNYKKVCFSTHTTRTRRWQETFCPV